MSNVNNENVRSTKWTAIWSIAAIGLTVTALVQGQAPPALTSSKKAVQEAQQRLQVLGYESGSADGVMGSRTVAALKKSQSDHGPSVTGVLDQKTLEVR